MTNYQEFLQVALDASVTAGDIIKSAFQQNFRDFKVKPDNTPVTIIDQQCEELIKDKISQAFPTHGFIGEETGSHLSAEFNWIIDPIDGTKNFIRGIPLFGSLIALMHGDKFVIGISNAPAMGEIVYASTGQGAFKNHQPIHVSAISQLSESFIAHAGLKGFSQKGLLPGLEKLVLDSWAYRGFGDAWAYHLVAQGAVEANLEAKIRVWDIAAASVIITEAGGQVSQLSGEPITLDSTTVLATNGLIHDKVLEYFDTKSL